MEYGIFQKIEYNYKINADEIMFKHIIISGKNNKIIKGFDIVKVSDENYQVKKEIKNNLILLEESPNSVVINKGFNIDNIIYDDIVPLKSSVYKIIINYFDNYLKETCFIE